jgi:ATP/ADP translocase
MTREALKAWGWMFKAVLPALVLIAGGILLFRRRAR